MPLPNVKHLLNIWGVDTTNYIHTIDTKDTCTQLMEFLYKSWLVIGDIASQTNMHAANYINTITTTKKEHCVYSVIAFVHWLVDLIDYEYEVGSMWTTRKLQHTGWSLYLQKQLASIFTDINYKLLKPTSFKLYHQFLSHCSKNIDFITLSHKSINSLFCFQRSGGMVQQKTMYTPAPYRILRKIMRDNFSLSKTLRICQHGEKFNPPCIDIVLCKTPTINIPKCDPGCTFQDFNALIDKICIHKFDSSQLHINTAQTKLIKVYDTPKRVRPLECMWAHAINKLICRTIFSICGEGQICRKDADEHAVRGLYLTWLLVVDISMLPFHIQYYCHQMGLHTVISNIVKCVPSGTVKKLKNILKMTLWQENVMHYTYRVVFNRCTVRCTMYQSNFGARIYSNYLCRTALYTKPRIVHVPKFNDMCVKTDLKAFQIYIQQSHIACTSKSQKDVLCTCLQKVTAHL